MDVSGLRTIDGLGIKVLATPGTEERARVMGQRTARAWAWLSDMLGFTPRVTLCAVGPQDWSRVTDFPVFGFPHFVADDTIVGGSVPAPFFADLVAQPWPSLSEPTRAAMRATYGDPPDINDFAALLTVHELGHLYHVQSGFWFPERWVSELFSNIALDGWVSEEAPELGAVLRTFPRCAFDVDASLFPERRLERMEFAFDAGPIGPALYGWYQMRLHAAAETIWRAGGRDLLRRLFDTFRDGAPADPRAALLDIHPAFGTVIDSWPH